ncbi:MAG: PIG-L deacetylase family protein [Vulcanimicrobiota bacterium]
MFTVPSKIVVIAAHTDDGEMGCGGTINKLVEEGHEVHYIAFSSCAESLKSLRPELPPDTLIREVKRATKILGIREENLHIYDFRVRRFFESRQDILEALVAFREQYQPSIVFAPSIHDIHQDHHIVAMEAIRAFKEKTILAYEVPWNNIMFETRCFISLEERHVDKKVEALLAYESQSGRQYMSPTVIRSLLLVRGSSIKTTFAESFDVVRLVMS